METLKHYLNRIITKEQARSIIFFEILLGILGSAVSLIIFSDITNAVLNQQTITFDSTVINIVFSLRSVWLTKIMLVFSLFGNQILMLGAIVIIVFLTGRKHRKESFIFTLLLLLGLFSTQALKILYEVPRPHVLPLAIEESYSYPSGHALNSFLFYSTIAYFIFHFTRSSQSSSKNLSILPF